VTRARAGICAVGTNPSYKIGFRGERVGEAIDVGLLVGVLRGRGAEGLAGGGRAGHVPEVRALGEHPGQMRIDVDFDLLHLVADVEDELRGHRVRELSVLAQQRDSALDHIRHCQTSTVTSIALGSSEAICQDHRSTSSAPSSSGAGRNAGSGQPPAMVSIAAHQAASGSADGSSVAGSTSGSSVYSSTTLGSASGTRK